MNEPRKSAGAIFDAAIELPSEERAMLLEKTCAGDAALRQRVEALLGAHEEAGKFMAVPAQLPVARATDSTLKDQSGERIGRYKLLQQIGEGGCGVVYMAEQEEPVRRRVALKVIKLGMDTKNVIARFAAEQQALAMMDHPNIARVLDAGATEAGRPYFVMELVRGVKITDYCDENNFSIEERLKLFIRVCHAIQHAHQKGIIHRDIKPSNILVTISEPGSPGCPKVIDFGIAKATTGQCLTDKTVFTAFEQFIGTPAYMSPEQAMMTSLDIDTRTDIYALGVLLYELLTGKTPFDQKELLAAGLDAMRRTICEVEPVKPSTRLTQERLAQPPALSNSALRPAAPKSSEGGTPHSAIDGDLDWIVMKCLEKDRVRRYETADSLAMDIQLHLNDEPVIARPPSTAYRFRKFIRRNKFTFAAAASISLTILLALAFLMVSNLRTIKERNQKDIALQEKAAALAEAKASEQRAREELFASLRSQAQVHRYSRQMGQRLESLKAVAQAKQIRFDAALRDEAIAAMALPDVRRGPIWHAARTNCSALTCDALGQRYAQLDYQGVVTVRSIADNQKVHRFETGRAVAGLFTSLAFSPDGRFLAEVVEGQKPLVWSLDDGEAIPLDAPEGASAPTFSADHRFVAFASGEEVYCFELATGREANHWKTSGWVHSLQFHPTEFRIAVGYKDGPRASVYDAASGREIAQLEVGVGWRMVVNWHPDGRQLAVGSTALGIQIWDLEAQRRIARLESGAQEVDFLTFHPSGNWLASWSWDGVMRLWDPTTGRQAMQIPLVANLQFSRDGSWLGFFWPSEDQAQLLEFVTPQEYFTLQDNSGTDRISHNDCAITPEDRLLAVATDDAVHLWDLPTAREIAVLPSGHSETVVFEPPGQALWTCGTSNGLQRWPIRSIATNGPELVLGPPQRIALPIAPYRLAADRAVQKLAMVSEAGGQAMVFDLAKQLPFEVPVSHPMGNYIALSPDAKWLATSGWHSDRAQLWNLQAGKLMQDWVVGPETRVAFTPNSQELILGRGSEFRFLKAETLETSRELKREVGLYPGNVAFSPDEKLMAMEMAPSVIHLKEVATGRTVAQLEDPFGDRSNVISFTHDGTRLIVLSTYASAIHVWDLRAIRSRLKPMGLDWDWPEFTPLANPESKPTLSRPHLRAQVLTSASP
jgi:serine/threonine protein kinase/WD40 repeat protein